MWDGKNLLSTHRMVWLTTALRDLVNTDVHLDSTTPTYNAMYFTKERDTKPQDSQSINSIRSEAEVINIKTLNHVRRMDWYYFSLTTPSFTFPLEASSLYGTNETTI